MAQPFARTPQEAAEGRGPGAVAQSRHAGLEMGAMDPDVVRDRGEAGRPWSLNRVLRLSLLPVGCTRSSHGVKANQPRGEGNSERHGAQLSRPYTEPPARLWGEVAAELGLRKRGCGPRGPVEGQDGQVAPVRSELGAQARADAGERESGRAVGEGTPTFRSPGYIVQHRLWFREQAVAACCDKGGYCLQILTSSLS